MQKLKLTSIIMIVFISLSVCSLIPVKAQDNSILTWNITSTAGVTVYIFYFNANYTQTYVIAQVVTDGNGNASILTVNPNCTVFLQADGIAGWSQSIIQHLANNQTTVIEKVPYLSPYVSASQYITSASENVTNPTPIPSASPTPTPTPIVSVTASIPLGVLVAIVAGLIIIAVIVSSGIHKFNGSRN